MTISDFGLKKRGRPRREEAALPGHIQRAIALRCGGATWAEAAEAVGIQYKTLRKYVRDHPDCQQLIKQQNQDALDQSHSTLIAGAPRVAERLLEIALDPKTKNYAAVSACEAVFRIIQTGIIDRENTSQLTEIKEQLDELEGGKIIDV